MASSAALAPVFEHIEANRPAFLDRLIDYLRHPSISAENIGIAEVGNLLLRMLGDIGLQASLIPTEGHPMVIGRWEKAPGKPTVLLYGHYDVQPVDPTRPVMVTLKLDYAVCEKICIPVKGEASLWLEPGVTTVTSARLESYEARIPLPVKPGPHAAKLSVLDARLDDGVVDPGLKLTLQAPPDGKIEDIFVEGPGMWSFGRPHLTTQPDGLVTAQIRINERPKGTSGPVPLIFTVRGTPKPVETRLELDIPAGKP